jgi:hypothetical protein
MINKNKMATNNDTLTKSLMKVMGFFNYRGLLVEKTKEGFTWNNKKFQSLKELETYLGYKQIISTQ